MFKIGDTVRADISETLGEQLVQACTQACIFFGAVAAGAELRVVQVADDYVMVEWLDENNKPFRYTFQAKRLELV